MQNIILICLLFSNSYPQPEQAFVWMIPLFVLGSAFILTTVGIIYSKRTERLNGKSISIIGMTAAGKTTLLKQLQGLSVSGSYAGTNYDDYEGFNINVKGKNIKIKGGTDIGGGEVYIKARYEGMIRNSDNTFFVFDCYKYKNNIQYAMDVRARMDFIFRKAKEHGKEIVTIGSHLDKFGRIERIKLINDIKKSVNGKPYEDLIDKNFFLLNLMEKEGIDKMMEKIF